MQALCVAALAAAALPAAAQGKGANEVVYAALGDWGWGAGGENRIIVNSLPEPCASFSSADYVANASKYAACFDGDKLQQGMLVKAGLANVGQKAVAKAMAEVCAANGACDFVLSSGDNFYDLGITQGLNDVQWTSSWSSVYTKELFPAPIKFVATLGNHDYSITAPDSAASEIKYGRKDSRWEMRGRYFDNVFSSADSKTKVHVVTFDSTPLHDRYIFSGASGGKYATSKQGVKDKFINAPLKSIIINSGVTADNGWTALNGWLGGTYNASNFECGDCTDGDGESCGYNLTTGTALSGVPSGCKYASAELAQFAHPRARSQAYLSIKSLFKAKAGKVQHQIGLTHFPVLSMQQRLTPFYDDMTAALGELSASNAAPSVIFNGHDHIMAVSEHPNITSNGAPIAFVTTGAGGISDYGLATTLGFLNGAPPGGYMDKNTNGDLLAQYISATFKAQPASGSNASSTSYNPDVKFATFYSELNGFNLAVANETHNSVMTYLVNCVASEWAKTGSCNVSCTSTPQVNCIGPIATRTTKAKVMSPAPAPTAPAEPTPVGNTDSVGWWVTGSVIVAFFIITPSYMIYAIYRRKQAAATDNAAPLNKA